MKFLYLIYQLFIALPIMLVVTIIAAIACIIGSLFDNRFWGYWPGMIWGRLFCLVFLIPVKIHGQENIRKGQSYVIVSNHQSFFDIFALYGHIGIYFKWMMKKEIGAIPFVGWACRMAGHICVNRESKISSVNSMKQAKEQLTDGMSLLVFPEGTRTATGEMGRFKRGAFQIASDLSLPILPVTLNGCFDVMPRKAWHASWHRIDITIHKSVGFTSGIDDAERTAAIRIMADNVAKIIEGGLQGRE